jgi:hypothetical protein
MALSFEAAAALMRREAALAGRKPIDQRWQERVEELSRLCEVGKARTHVAFLGTSILARATDSTVDLFAIKPTRYDGEGEAYCARNLCERVLVPLAAELGIHLGVTGRQPLNNQPYFRINRLGDNTSVRKGGAKAAFDYAVELVHILQALNNTAEARRALRAFIAVRRRFQPRYASDEGELKVTPESLVDCIATLVGENSEGGKRAQAVVAGLFDIFAGDDRVESGRINDPSRKYPGDVCIGSHEEVWEKAIEVRDKPVSTQDVQIFGKKCVDMGVREAAVVMASPRQLRLDDAALAAWAAGFGIGLTLFYGWSTFVDQALFWAPPSKPDAALEAVERIEVRLIAVEASPEAVLRWQALTRT